MQDEQYKNTACQPPPLPTSPPTPAINTNKLMPMHTLRAFSRYPAFHERGGPGEGRRPRGGGPGSGWGSAAATAGASPAALTGRGGGGPGNLRRRRGERRKGSPAPPAHTYPGPRGSVAATLRQMHQQQRQQERASPRAATGPRHHPPSWGWPAAEGQRRDGGALRPPEAALPGGRPSARRRRVRWRAARAVPRAGSAPSRRGRLPASAMGMPVIKPWRGGAGRH